MTSRPASNAAGVGRLKRGTDAVPPAAGSNNDCAGTALCGFLCGSLTAAQEVIEQTLARQHEMMDVVSRLAFGGEQPDLESEEMGELVAALQSDDLIRQELENLARTQAVMLQAVQDVLGAANDGPVADALPTPPGDRWTGRLMEAVTLEEMRQRFSRHLAESDGD